MKTGIIDIQMKRINYIVVLVSVTLTSALSATATDPDVNRSRRSSICSILVKHDEQKFAEEIERQFNQIPIPDRFNEHNLSVRVVNAGRGKLENASIEAFIKNNAIASRLVGRWFDRNILTGECSLDTIKSRGLYDASLFDRELSARSTRGLIMLEDAGEDLIRNTFLLLHEVNYVDKSKRAAIWASIGSAAVGALMAAGGASGTDISNAMNNTATIINSYKGFSVKIRTRLYRLTWNPEISTRFYNECFSMSEDENKKMAFENMRSDFCLEYVGEVVSKGSRTSFLGIKEDAPELMVRKACARAIDENIADLQHRFEPFRIKTPIVSVEPAIKAHIGKKEGITASSKFEVLEVREKNGKIEYHRVGTVRPVSSQIWDNRFMADAEGGIDAGYGATSFVKISGGDFYPGMLLREID